MRSRTRWGRVLERAGGDLLGCGEACGCGDLAEGGLDCCWPRDKHHTDHDHEQRDCGGDRCEPPKPTPRCLGSDGVFEAREGTLTVGVGWYRVAG